MELSDIFPGQRVRVFDWISEEFDPPEHWSTEMEDWIGCIVTIDKIHDDGGIFIKEDHNEWMWDPTDFEFYDNLPRNNPNTRFAKAKKKERMHEVRQALLEEFRKARKE